MSTSTFQLEPPLSRPEHDAPLQVLLVIGNTRRDRVGPAPAAWAAECARKRDDVAVSDQLLWWARTLRSARVEAAS